MFITPEKEGLKKKKISIVPKPGAWSSINGPELLPSEVPGAANNKVSHLRAGSGGGNNVPGSAGVVSFGGGSAALGIVTPNFEQLSVLTNSNHNSALNSANIDRDGTRVPDSVMGSNMKNGDELEIKMMES